MSKRTYTKKEEKAWELTQLWYIILSHTTNVFTRMSKQKESEWEQTFTRNNYSRYTTAQLDAEIQSAREYAKHLGAL